MKKLLLLLLCLFNICALRAAEEAIMFSVSDSEYKSKTNLKNIEVSTDEEFDFYLTDINGKTYDFIGNMVWWAPNTVNSYIAFAKNEAGAGYIVLPSFEKPIQSISILPSADNYTNIKFILCTIDSDEALYTFSYKNSQAVKFTPEIPLKAGVRYKIMSANTKNKLGLRNIRITFAESAIEPATVSKPAITPAGGNISTTDEITLNCATEGATIKYQIDGGAENTYQTSFSLAAGEHIVKAWATKTGMTASETAEATFTVSEPVAPTPDNGRKFRLITSADHLIEGKSYLFAARGTSATYVMGKPKNASAINIQKAETSFDLNVSEIKIANDATGFSILTLGKGSDTATGSSQYYFTDGSSSENIKYLNPGTSTTANELFLTALSATKVKQAYCTIEFTGSTPAIIFTCKTSRNEMAYQKSANYFSCFNSDYVTGYCTPILLFEEVPVESSEKKDAGLAFTPDTAEIFIDDTAAFNAPVLSNPNNLPIDYTSLDETVAIVDKTTGNVTIKGAGSTEIHAVFDGDDEYKAADVFYTLTVKDPYAGSYTFDFITKDYGLPRSPDSQETVYNPDITIINNDTNPDIKITVTNITGNNYLSNRGWDFSEGTYSIEVEMPAGIQMQEITFDTSEALSDISSTSGAANDNVWKGESRKETITFSATSIVTLASLKVKYTVLEVEEPQAYCYSEEVSHGQTAKEGDIRFSTAEGAEIYICFEPIASADAVRRAAADYTPDETLTADGKTFTRFTEPLYQAQEKGTLHYIAARHGRLSNIKTLYIDTLTGVDKTGVSTPGIRWFDLQGRSVANPVRGIYIKVAGDKHEKIVIR